MRVAKFSHSASFWIGVTFAALIALQILPIPGIYLMMFGAPVLAGLLAHVLLASLFLESIIGRIPPAFAAIPVLAYGAYYADYFYEGWAIHKEAGIVRSDEPDVALRFDPAKQSLVVKDAWAFVSDYDVPVAYEVDANVKPDGYESYRLLPADQCAIARSARAMPGKTRVLPRGHGKFGDDPSCVFATPERPPRAIVAISGPGADEMWKRTPGIVEASVVVALAGQPIATYVAGAYAWRLSPFPFVFIGCALIDNPAEWWCGEQFDRKLTQIGRIDATKSEELVFALAADMLGVGKLPTAGGHAVPRPTDDLDVLLAKLPKIPELARIEPGNGVPPDGGDLFAAFAGFLASDEYATTKSGAWTMLVVDGADYPSRDLTDAVVGDPARAGPLRDQMIAKLVAMRAHGVSGVSGWVGLVEHGLRVIPKPVFVAIPDDSLASLLQYLDASEEWRSGGLYERAADVGKRALPFYSDQIVRYAHIWPQGKHPALAICRIGEADDAARQALRAAYLKFLPGDPKKMSFNVEQYGSALFLALLATGDEQFLRDNPVSGADAMESEWLGLLLDGKGRVDGKPNNCHVIDRLRVQPNDPMGPGLAWNDGHWLETAAAGRP
jgi:hypothetical protein